MGGTHSTRFSTSLSSATHIQPFCGKKHFPYWEREQGKQWLWVGELNVACLRVTNFLKYIKASKQIKNHTVTHAMLANIRTNDNKPSNRERKPQRFYAKLTFTLSSWSRQPIRQHQHHHLSWGRGREWERAVCLIRAHVQTREKTDKRADRLDKKEKIT